MSQVNTPLPSNAVQRGRLKTPGGGHAKPGRARRARSRPISRPASRPRSGRRASHPVTPQGGSGALLRRLETLNTLAVVSRASLAGRYEEGIRLELEIFIALLQRLLEDASSLLTQTLNTPGVPMLIEALEPAVLDPGRSQGLSILEVRALTRALQRLEAMLRPGRA